MEQHTIERLGQARGLPVYASDGDKIGEVEEIYYDVPSRQPEWIGVGAGFFGTKRVLVPVRDAELSDDGLRVRHSKDKVKGAPDIDSDEISEATERELYEYYGVSRPEGSYDTSDVSRTSGDTVTRHEEELRVGKQETEAGRARLRKWVETEPVELDVDLQRETARVTRDAVDQPVSGSAIGEEEVEVELREERPVVQKQAVAKERVGLEKDVETERQTVRDEVRKEQVDVDESS